MYPEDPRSELDPRARRPWVVYSVSIALAFLLGVASASYPAWQGSVQQLLLKIGSAHLANLEAVKQTQYRASEYLVVLNNDQDRGAAERFFASHPGIDYLGASVFPHTLRIALQVPVTSARQDLEAQAFTRLVLPNHLLLFCQ